MTFKGVVWKNFKFNIRKYTALFLCSTLTIAIFFIFANLTLCEEISDFLKKAGMGADYFFYIMCFVLAVFSIGFIAYINSSKNKSRSKEFGLYMTLGMSYKDITKLIILEDTVIVSTSILSGTLVGMVFSRLFFMINIKMIGEESGNFVLDYRSFIFTALIFTIVYLVNLFVTIISRRKMNIRALITADRETEFTEKSHPILATLGILMLLVLVVTSIVAALSRDVAMKQSLIISAIFIGMAGIYLIITNIVGLIQGFAKRNQKFYAKSLLNLSELKYTSKKNSNMIFILSLLSGMILMCSASTFALLNMAEKMVEDSPEHKINYIEAMGVNKFDVKMVDSLVEDSGAGVEIHLEFPCTFVNKTDNSNNSKIPVCVLSQSTLNNMYGQSIKLGDKDIKILAADPMLIPAESKLSQIEITNGKITKKLELTETVIQKAFSTEIVLGNRYMLIVSDKIFSELTKSNEQLNGTIHNILVKEWKKSGSVFDKLNSLNEPNNPLTQHLTIAGSYAGYKLMRHLYSTFVFVTNFVSLLFFAATILITLFRQYENIDKMARKYTQLRKLGILRKEFEDFVNSQTKFLFIIPLVCGLIFGSCNMLIVQSIMGGNDFYKEFWTTSAVIASIYIVLQLVFCKFVATGFYKKILSSASVK